MKYSLKEYIDEKLGLNKYPIKPPLHSDKIEIKIFKNVFYELIKILAGKLRIHNPKFSNILMLSLDIEVFGQFQFKDRMFYKFTFSICENMISLYPSKSNDCLNDFLTDFEDWEFNHFPNHSRTPQIYRSFTNKELLNQFLGISYKDLRTIIEKETLKII